MKRVLALLSLAAIVFAAPRARAEVKVMLKTEHAAYVQYESLLAFVWIWNDREIPLEVGEGVSDGIAMAGFHVGRRRDDREPARREGAPLGTFRLEPGESRRFAVDLGKWYDIGSAGTHRLCAFIKEGNEYVFSPVVQVDIVGGYGVTAFSREIPGYAGVRRNYNVVAWKRGNFEHMFLSVSDEPDGVNQGVFDLGPGLRAYTPELIADRDGRFTVRHQRSQFCFVRTVFRSDATGVEFVDQRFELEDGRPYPRERPRLQVKFPGEGGDKPPRERDRKRKP
jgi:hypothetical protein